MLFQENQSLKSLNTFGVDAKARWFCALRDRSETVPFLEHLSRLNKPLLVLGGGSNILFTQDFEGVVLKMEMTGIDILEETADRVIVKVGAGTCWDEFVSLCSEKGWAGVENLSLIPGTTGGGPIQNIGAYGAEIGEVISEVTYTEISTGRECSLEREQCRFGYRNSIFKNELRGKAIITQVTFSLTVQHSAPQHLTSSPPRLRLDYGSIRRELQTMGVNDPGVGDVRNAVIRIRRSKLPDPAELGNAGSFFKNPVIPADQGQALKERYPDITVWPDPAGMKIPAAWLIEQCGWKGKRIGQAGVHINHPLILVNHGGATGPGILCLAGQIRDSVLEKFGIALELEVNVI